MPRIIRTGKRAHLIRTQINGAASIYSVRMNGQEVMSGWFDECWDKWTELEASKGE